MMSPERDRGRKQALTEFVQQEERVLAGISETVELANEELKIQQARSVWAIRKEIGEAVTGVVGRGLRDNLLEIFPDVIRTVEIEFLAFKLNGGRFTVPDYKNVRILTNTEGELALRFELHAKEVIREVPIDHYLQAARAIAPTLDDYRENPDSYTLQEDISKVWGSYRGQLVKTGVTSSPAA